MKFISEEEVAERIYGSIANENIRLVIQNIIGYSIQRARGSKQKYMICLFLGVICNAVILVLNVQSAPSITRTMIAIMSAVAFVSSSLQAGLQWKGNWSSYRISAEKLKSEGMSFFAKTEMYEDLSDDEREKRLLVNCQKILAEEGMRWRLANKSDESNREKNM